MFPALLMEKTSEKMVKQTLTMYSVKQKSEMCRKAL